jgi:hypothetical protein
MSAWMTDGELLDACEGRIAAARAEKAELTKGISAAVAAGDGERAQRKRRLRARWGAYLAQAIQDAANIRAGMADKPPVGRARRTPRAAGSGPPRGL